MSPERNRLDARYRALVITPTRTATDETMFCAEHSTVCRLVTAGVLGEEAGAAS